jgi:hypothetical protein
MSRVLSVALTAVMSASLALPLTAGAASQVSGTATLRQFSIQLVDLDLTDGITPSLSLLATTRTGQVSLSYQGPDGYEAALQSFGLAGDPPGGEAASASTVLGNGRARSVVTGAGLLDGGRLVNRGSLQAPLPEGGCDYWNCLLPTSELLTGASGGLSFALSANTALYISAVANLSASAVGGGTFPYGEDLFPFRFESGLSASAELMLQGGAANGGAGTQSSTDSAEVWASTTWDWGTETYLASTSRDSGLLRVSFLNTSDGWLAGELTARVSMFGNAYNDVFPLPVIHAVPEPATTALWLAGIASLGALRRRSRAR